MKGYEVSNFNNQINIFVVSPDDARDENILPQETQKTFQKVEFDIV